MPFLLLVQHSFRTPLLFILRDCGLMRNDEGRQAAEWVGIHMLQSTGKPILSAHTHTLSQTHTCLRVPLPPATEKPCSPNVQCPLSVNISSVPTLMWQNISRAQKSQALLCDQMFPALTATHHVAQFACPKFGIFAHSGQLDRLQVPSELIN